ncbi:hypothetical protein B0J13DRAFT_13735 [Dactylonectria estremocensis]|uniref:DUF7729 domain-containing protein n=1 Tax=Dactylonectria estremocensis TaxID=1079267 RepID=A0A9P9JDK5_9HYPO|nr:hypothetical protein B0J13DRAFT_13735 [Dactylonectria estremocensis]
MAASASSSHVTRPSLRFTLSLLFVVLCLASGALARPETRHPRFRVRRSADLADLKASIPPARNEVDISPEDQLRKRAVSASDDDDEDTTTDEASTKTKAARKTSTSTSTHAKTTAKTTSKDTATATVTTLTISITDSEVTATADVTSSPLPEAFDGDLDGELDIDGESNCPAFLDSVLANPSYEACYPLSMMLQTSQGFFNAQKQLLSIVRVLDATCAANVTYCTEFFDAAAANLTAEGNCKKEYNSGNTVVKQFLFGLQAYEMMYQSTCLQDPDDDMYCFANAVTNLTTASNAYFYYLPYNLTLPGSTVPACSWCIQETMAIFHTASADRSQPVSNTYEAAARQVNTICGLDFVNSSLAEEATSASPNFMPSWTVMAASVVGVALVNALL